MNQDKLITGEKEKKGFHKLLAASLPMEIFRLRAEIDENPREPWLGWAIIV